MPLPPGGGRDLDAVLLQLVPVHLEDLDLDHHLRALLVHDVDDALGRRHLVRRVVDGERVGAGQRGHPPRAEHDAQEVDRLLQVGVGQEERLHHLLLVVAPLVRRVGQDHDHARVQDAVEGVADAGDRVQGLLEADVAQIDGDGLVPELRVEHEVDPGRLAQRLVDLAQAGAAEGEAERLLGARAQGEAGQAALARAVLHLFDGRRRRVAAALRLRGLDLAGKRRGVGVEVQGQLAARRAPPCRGRGRGGAGRRWCAPRRRADARARGPCGSRGCSGWSLTAFEYSSTARS